MSPSVVAAFADHASALAAVDSLSQGDLAGVGLRAHENAESATNALQVEVDELATGGFFGNFAALLNDLFQTSVPETRAVTYEDKVRKEGAIVTARVGSAEEADRVSAALEARGALRISRLPQAGLED